jgi:hypothetical protein
MSWNSQEENQNHSDKDLHFISYGAEALQFGIVQLPQLIASVLFRPTQVPPLQRAVVLPTT